MFRKLAAEKKFHEMLSVMLQLWSGVLLIYTFGMNPLLGFFVSAVLWRLVKFDGKQKLNKKKLSLIVLLIAVSVPYKASEFVLNAVIGFTAFQALSFFSKLKCEARQNWFPMVYVTMAIYYTLRMTLVFSVPEILMPIHEGYMSAGKFLSENQIVEWIILMSLMALDMSIFLKRGAQEKLPLIMGLFSGVDPATGGYTAPQVTINMILLFKITFVAMMFVYMGSRVSKLVLKQFGSSGFSFTGGGA